MVCVWRALLIYTYVLISSRPEEQGDRLGKSRKEGNSSMQVFT